MPGLLQECREIFDTDDLYRVLDVSRKAGQNEGACHIDIQH